MATSTTSTATLSAQQIEGILSGVSTNLQLINGTLSFLNTNATPQPLPDRPTINAQLQTLQGQLNHSLSLVAGIQQKVNAGS